MHFDNSEEEWNGPPDWIEQAKKDVTSLWELDYKGDGRQVLHLALGASTSV